MASPKKTLYHILFWSVISAAFIGPGTISTASKAGSDLGYELLWALLLSTLGCMVLQEAAARLPLVSGLNLGQAIGRRYGKRSFAAILALSAILIGGIAYEAGNILGAVAGASQMLHIDSLWLVLLIGLSAALLLWKGSFRFLAQFLGLVVAAMGLAFLLVVSQLNIDWGALLQGLVIPKISENSGWLVIGLIGTTIVPYNLFLASGIQQKGEIKTMRLGLLIAIAIGGLISMIVLIAATGLAQSFSFEVMTAYMEAQLGAWGANMFGLGLFAAGFSSALTAPLAAAITVESILENDSEKPATQSRRGRWVWGSVLLAGMLFGLLAGGENATPEAVIIAAQALNGLLLPAISIMLLLLINDQQFIPRERLNPPVSNILLLLMVGISSFLGLVQLLKAAAKVAGTSLPESFLPWLGLIALGLMLGLYAKTTRLRQ